MKIDGNKISQEIINKLNRKPSTLKIILVGNDRASEVFVGKKRQLAERLGVDFELKQYPESVNESEIINQINVWQESIINLGIVIQLPLPKHLDRDNLIRMIKPECDVDGMLFCLKATENPKPKYQMTNEILSPNLKNNNLTIQQYNNEFIPPVVLAIERAILESKLILKNRKIVIVGHGFLVGQPLFKYFVNKYHENEIVSLGKQDDDYFAKIKEAEILIGAANAGGIITLEMIKDGVILIDAGSAEENGALAGNIRSDCYSLALFYTPVPGGIGPMTVAYLFSNLLNHHV